MAPKDDIEPGVQAIFDAMFAYMTAEEIPSCNCFANATGSGTSYGISCTQINGDQFGHTWFTQGTRVILSPTNVSLGPGGQQQFTATANDASGAPIASPAFTWSLAAGNPGTIDATGLFTAPATIPAQTVVTVTARLTGSPAWTAISMGLHP